MRLRLITAPASEVVTSAEAKAHLRVDHADDDALIIAYLTSARAHLDGRDGILGRALMTQTWELVLDTFPVAQIALPLPPLQSITSIKYQDSNNVEQTMDAADYVVDATSEPACVHPATAWPSTYSTPNAATIRFVAGYGNASAVPEPIKTAIKLKVQALYDNVPPDQMAAIDRASDALTWPYRVMSV